MWKGRNATPVAVVYHVESKYMLLNMIFGEFIKKALWNGFFRENRQLNQKLESEMRVVVCVSFLT